MPAVPSANAGSGALRVVDGAGVPPEVEAGAGVVAGVVCVAVGVLAVCVPAGALALCATDGAPATDTVLVCAPQPPASAPRESPSTSTAVRRVSFW